MYLALALFIAVLISVAVLGPELTVLLLVWIVGVAFWASVAVLMLLGLAGVVAWRWKLRVERDREFTGDQLP